MHFDKLQKKYLQKVPIVLLYGHFFAFRYDSVPDLLCSAQSQLGTVGLAGEQQPAASAAKPRPGPPWLDTTHNEHAQKHESRGDWVKKNEDDSSLWDKTLHNMESVSA